MSSFKLKYGSLILLTCKTNNIFCGKCQMFGENTLFNNTVKKTDTLFNHTVEKADNFNDENKRSNVDIFKNKKNIELNKIENGKFIKEKEYVDFNNETINNLTPGYLYELKTIEKDRFKYGEWNDYYYIKENQKEYTLGCIITKVENDDSELKMALVFIKDNKVFLASKKEREGFLDYNEDICLDQKCGWIWKDILYMGIRNVKNIFPLIKDGKNIRYYGLKINLENKKKLKFADVTNIKDGELFKISIKTVKENNLVNWKATFTCHQLYKNTKNNKIVEGISKNICVSDLFDKSEVKDFYCYRQNNRFILFYENVKTNKICLLKIWEMSDFGVFNYTDRIAFSEIKNGRCSFLLKEDDLINSGGKTTKIIPAFKLENAKDVEGILLIDKVADVE